ncbi:glucan 1,4-alpha-glucosidase [Nakamurella panacisegetis]|uniref:Glucan 1,4-alpha-glucosidase n=1 Tax=Nakamurella panacisegetis TaxID=1090615 RepID=A0A1H0KH40_9ACTN|nr:glucodextranase DOMON-like domain-containing protein [Nakamurella panacisegetis]SDO55237.1 glucan 1,4-alpha-glucosidase [Nakamurella panacisegetis]
MKRSRLRLALLACAVAASGWGALPAAAVPATTAPPAAAADGPGTLSHFDLARKDCLGTARNTTSKIWYTVAGGVLSDVYAPTVDTTNVQTMQFLVSDGSSFTDLQSRDMTYTVSADRTGMTCTVVSTAKSGQYRLTTTYLTDTNRSSVVVHTRYTPLVRAAAHFRLYVRLDATVGGNGGGGPGNGGADSATVDRSTGSPVPVSYDTVTTTNAANRDYAVPSYLALRADRPFTAVSSGFVGSASDGLAELDAGHTLSPLYDNAASGNVEQTAAVSLGRDGSSTLALGFGTTQAAAVATAGATARTPLPRLLAQYEAGWLRYDAGLRHPWLHRTGLTRAQQAAAVKEYYVSANAVKSSEDKTFPGAIVASLASPWGQAVSAGDPANTYFGSYREVFARDLYEAFTALLTDGDLSTARASTRFLLLQQQLPDGSMPRNTLVNGKVAPDSFNIQLDEAAYPILMALQSGLGGDNALWPHIKSAANFLISHGPASGPERWEEQGGYSPSTIAAEIAGLVAAGTIARQHGDADSARVWLATADQYQRSIKGWSLTTNGPLSAQPYFIRLSKTGDPNAAITYNVGNGGPTLDQRSVIDAGFLELVRLGELSASDPDVQNSLKVVDATLEKQTPSGPGWLRYNGDGYGDCSAPADGGCTTPGAPWAPSNKGTGHIWPVLSAERGEQELAAGNGQFAGQLLAAIDNMSSGVGLVPEQDWDTGDLAASAFGTDPTVASIGFVDGRPAGSAAPLTWGSASQVRLVADLSTGRVLEQPRQTVDRYVKHAQGSTTLTVTSPQDGSAATGTVQVTGTAAVGATVDVADVATDGNSATTVASAEVGASGTFSIPVTVAAGANVLVVTATARNGGTAQQVVSVINDIVVGTKIYDQADPTGDDNGPGNYAYPTASDFHAGAYDLTDFQIYDTGSTITFRVQTRDLTATFGSALGAQLIDLYVTAPGATPTSTGASYASRNYRLATPWSRLLEVQGFGQRFIDAAGTTVGTITISAKAISRYITFTVDKSALGGTPASGWKFALTLTGQDGFSPDNARVFAPTPQPYAFGECSAGSTGPLCTADPGNLPKIMDTLVPAGVLQSDELDYTQHDPVVVSAVTLP